MEAVRIIILRPVDIVLKMLQSYAIYRVFPLRKTTRSLHPGPLVVTKVFKTLKVDFCDIFARYRMGPSIVLIRYLGTKSFCSFTNQHLLHFESPYFEFLKSYNSDDTKLKSYSQFCIHTY